jgi:hypothetical protein
LPLETIKLPVSAEDCHSKSLNCLLMLKIAIRNHWIACWCRIWGVPVVTLQCYLNIPSQYIAMFTATPGPRPLWCKKHPGGRLGLFGSLLDLLKIDIKNIYGPHWQHTASLRWNSVDSCSVLGLCDSKSVVDASGMCSGIFTTDEWLNAVIPTSSHFVTPSRCTSLRRRGSHYTQYSGRYLEFTLLGLREFLSLLFLNAWQVWFPRSELSASRLNSEFLILTNMLKGDSQGVKKTGHNEYYWGM